jgi:hypothetical protein
VVAINKLLKSLPMIIGKGEAQNRQKSEMVISLALLFACGTIYVARVGLNNGLGI